MSSGSPGEVRDISSAASVVEIVRSWAIAQPDRPAYTFLDDKNGTESTCSYGDIDRRARAIGAWQRSMDTENRRGILLYPPGTEFVAALLGCFYGGVTAVPVPR